MRRSSHLVLAAAAVLAFVGCADSGTSQTTSERENQRQLCQRWVGDPDDEKCLSTFRRILP